MLSYRDFRIPWNVARTSRGLPSGDVARLGQLQCLVPGEELVRYTRCFATHVCRLAAYWHIAGNVFVAIGYSTDYALLLHAQLE